VCVHKYNNKCNNITM